jgi:hypothetical protein
VLWAFSNPGLLQFCSHKPHQHVLHLKKNLLDCLLVTYVQSQVGDAKNLNDCTWKPTTTDKFSYTGKIIPSFILNGNKLLGSWVLKNHKNKMFYKFKVLLKQT